MRTRAVLLSALVLLSFGGCTSTAAPAADNGAYGIGCPCCFTIVESVRSGLLPVEHHLHVQCEICCAELTFFWTPGGRVMVVSDDSVPLHCDLAAPAR